MKKLFIFLLLLNSCFSWSKDTIHDKKITFLETRIDSLERKIQSSENKTHSDAIVGEYKDLNNLYSYGFGILLALFGIVFPMIIYLVQIKPSLDTIKETKKLLKKIDEDFEKSFEEHLRKNKNKLIDRAIDNFLNKATESLPSSYTLLDTYKSEGFTEMQVIKLLKIMRQEDSDKQFIASILPFQKDSNTEDFFENLIKTDPSNEICIWGAIYFANFNKSEHMDLIANIILNGYALVGMLASLSHSSKEFTLKLMNNEVLVNGLNETEIVNWGNYGAKFMVEKTNSQKVESTLLWKKYLEIK